MPELRISRTCRKYNAIKGKNDMTELEFSSEKDVVFIDLDGRKEPFAKITRANCLDSEKLDYAAKIAAAMNDKFGTK
jgi:hypothetical protein